MTSFKRFYPIALALALSTALSCANGYQFIMQGATQRCFEEEIPLATNVLVTYTVLQGTGEAPMSLKITDSQGRSLLDKDHVTSGKHVFTTADSLPNLSRDESQSGKDDEALDDKIMRKAPDTQGDSRLKHRFCFELRQTGHHMPHLHAPKEPSRRVIFNVKFGADANTLEYYELLAKEKHLSSTENLFKAVEDLVSDVVKEIDEMRTRERRMETLNNKTRRIVLWYSAFACLIVISGALYSSSATRSFLTREKII